MKRPLGNSSLPCESWRCPGFQVQLNLSNFDGLSGPFMSSGTGSPMVASATLSFQSVLRA